MVVNGIQAVARLLFVWHATRPWACIRAWSGGDTPEDAFCASLQDCLRAGETDCFGPGNTVADPCSSPGYSFCCSLKECIRADETNCPRYTVACNGVAIADPCTTRGRGYSFCCSLDECIEAYITDCPGYTVAEDGVAVAVAVTAVAPTFGDNRRRLSEGHTMHDTVITSNEMNTILQNCSDTNYDVVLYSLRDSFHFFLGIMVTETTTTDVDENENSTSICVPVPLGFESRNGDKLMVRTTTDNDDEENDDYDSYQKHNFGLYKLGDIIEAFNKVEAIPANDYNKITNNCVHFAQNIWRNLRVTEDPMLHSFLVSSIVHHNYFMEYAREHIGLSPFLSNILFGSKNTKIPAHYISYVKGYVASQLIMDSDVISVNPKDENDVYYNDPNPNVESLLKLLDGRKLVANNCNDAAYNADAVIMVQDDSDIFVGMVLEPVDSKDDDAGLCPWYLISTETDDDGRNVKALSVLDEKLASFNTMFHDKNLFLTHSIGHFPLRTLMESYDTVSAVGMGLPDDATYNLVDNNSAELTCNMVTDLGMKVDDAIITLIGSSIAVGAPSFLETVQSKGSTLTEMILWCLDEPKSSKNKTKSSKKK